MPDPVLEVLFYRSESGNEPVRDWLKALDRDSMRTIGSDILTVQLRWPVGLPLVRPMGDGLYEVRSAVVEGEARVLFVAAEGKMVLLHAFIKKTPKTPKGELRLAKERMKRLLT